jgi:hypothetical protein
MIGKTPEIDPENVRLFHGLCAFRRAPEPPLLDILEPVFLFTPIHKYKFIDLHIKMSEKMQKLERKWIQIVGNENQTATMKIRTIYRKIGVFLRVRVSKNQ